MDTLDKHHTYAGWVALIAAIGTSLGSQVGRYVGAPGATTEIIGVVTAFLAFSAACFGLKTYETVNRSKTTNC